MKTWKKGTVIAIDVETTGLDPEKDKIVELGTARMVNGKINKVHSRLINPGIPIPPEASAIHGITDKKVKDAPEFGDIVQKVADWLSTADVLVAYNWPFDASFMLNEMGDAWKWLAMTKPVIDPLVVVRLEKVGRFWKGKGRHKLENVIDRLGIWVDGNAHSAGTDCEMTLTVLQAFMDHLPDDADEAASLIVKQREEQDLGFQKWLESKS